MPKEKLPRFVIYQPNQKEFHICFEVGNKFLRWQSNYAPSLDVRFPREVKKIAGLPAGKIPKQRLFDQGTYTITRTDARAVAEKKLVAGIRKNSFAFILNGRKLQGRFSFRQVSGITVIQKYKDKYAKEEDVLSGDLSRTISTMVPDYDESKIKLAPKKTRKVEEPEEEVVEEITADKTIGNTGYHFAFYTAEDEADICLITNEKNEVIVLRQEGRRWVLVRPVSKLVLKREAEFAAHAKALYGQA